jgi:hypothetical protein
MSVEPQHQTIIGLPPTKPETVGERIRRLQAEARTLARDHIRTDVSGAAVALMAACAEIAEGGDAYPAGVRDLCRRWAEDLESRVQTLEAIVARSS